MTREKALAELAYCRESLELMNSRKYWQDYTNERFYYKVYWRWKPDCFSYCNRVLYYQDKINKLKQKYFFGENV